MKKKILSMALTLCMVLSLVPTPALAEEYPTTPTVRVGGLEMYIEGATKTYYVPGTEGSEPGIKTDESEAEDWTAKYDSDAETLTLRGFVYTGEGVALDTGDGPKSAAIYTDVDLNLILKGINSVTHVVTLNEGTGTSDYVSHGIYAGGNLSIDGEGSLTVTASNTEGSLRPSHGVYVVGNLTISGGELTANGGSTKTSSTSDNPARSSSYGLYGFGDISITGGDITANGGETTDTSNANAYCSSYGLFGQRNIVIGGGNVKANAGTTVGRCSSSIGLGGSGNITISGGIVTAKGNNTKSYNAYTCGIKQESINGLSITISGDAEVTALGRDSQQGETYGIYGYTSNVKITDNAIVIAASGNLEGANPSLWNAGLYSSSLTISGSSKVTATGGNYEGTTSSLVQSYGLRCVLNNINISGNATVTATGGEINNNGSNTSKSMGIEYGQLTIKDNAVVTAKGGDVVASTPSSFGLLDWNKKSITISGGTVTAISGNAAKKSGEPGVSSAMSMAPNTGSYKRVRVTASENAYGTDPVEEYSNENIAAYKYIKIDRKPDEKVYVLDLTDLLPAPGTGETPKYNISHDQFSTLQNIIWSPAITTGKFQGSMVYTAALTLTANDGYTFNGVGADMFTHTGADSISNSEGTGSTMQITIEFPETAPATLTGILITTNPGKTTYTYGESFDPAGMVVKAVYNDGTTVLDFKDYSISHVDTTIVGTSSVTVRANGTDKTATFTITVNKAAQTISFAESTINKKYGDAKFNVSVTGSKTPVTYTSSNNTIASVDSTTGEVTIVGAGSATITATAAVSANYTAATATCTINVDKADGLGAPEISGSYAVSGTNSDQYIYTINHIDGAEYMINGGNWKESNVFDGLTPGSTYTFYARYKETATHQAGVAATLPVTIPKLDNNSTPALSYTVSGASGNRTITITPVEGAEYCFDGTSFTAGNVLSGINNTTVTVYIRYKETATHNASAAASEEVNTAKATQTLSFADATVNKTYGDAKFTISAHQTVGDGVFTYVSSDDTVAAVNSSTGEVTIVGAGSATITATVAETDNYLPATASYTLNVNKKSIDAPSEDTTVFTYNGAAQTYTIATSADYTVSGNQRINAGSYIVVVALNDKANTQWEDSTGEDKTFSFVIQKAIITITASNKSAHVGASVPSLATPVKGTDYTVSGLFGADELTGVTMEYQKDGASATPNMSEAGSYSIVISGATAPAGDNYNAMINFVSGTLTVSTRPKSGGGGAGSPTPSHTVTPRVENGSVTLSETSARKGETMRLTPKADKGYELDTLIIKDEKGNIIPVTKNEDGTYSFTMPDGKVTVEAAFKPVEMPDTPRTTPFVDVKDGVWYHDAVKFANQNGLFAGTTERTFSPKTTMTREMLWTVLGRMDGENLSGNDVFDAAKAWATGKNISDGSNPKGKVTREQIVTILWRYAGSPAMDKSSLSAFDDAGNISTYAEQAMTWAYQMGLIQGSSGKLNPQGPADRAQVATIFMRYCKNVVE